MDQQNSPYESISSSMPTYESFSSQQNITIEDETIDVETIGNEDKKRKRKAPLIQETRSQCRLNDYCSKYEKDVRGVITQMAYSKWSPTFEKDDDLLKKSRGLDKQKGNKLKEKDKVEA
ncbi:hypothetical protein Tco_1134245 [Tanacetum coccineum]